MVEIEGNDPSYEAYETPAYPSRLYLHLILSNDPPYASRSLSLYTNVSYLVLHHRSFDKIKIRLN